MSIELLESVSLKIEQLLQEMFDGRTQGIREMGREKTTFKRQDPIYQGKTKTIKVNPHLKPKTKSSGFGATLKKRLLGGK